MGMSALTVDSARVRAGSWRGSTELAYLVPLSGAATLTPEWIYQVFLDEDMRRGFLHGHTYTANPIACAAALASLDLFERGLAGGNALEGRVEQGDHAVLHGLLLQLVRRARTARPDHRSPGRHGPGGSGRLPGNGNLGV